MTPDPPTDCARCGKTLQRTHRFCPECGLPATGGSVLSSQIDELRQEMGTAPRGRRPPWRRLLVPTASAVMVALVLAVGLLLFNRPLIEMFFPPGEEAVAAPLEIAPRWEPKWVQLPAGTFHSGPPFEISEADLNLYPTVEENIAFHLITNGDWLEFLLNDEEHLRALGVWEDAVPRLAAGWVRDPSGRPVILPAPGSDEPAVDELVSDVELHEIELYRRWIVGSPEYRIAKYGISNGRWMEFLRRERERLEEEGVWEDVMPGRSSGWSVDSTGNPVLPSGPRADVQAGPLDVLAAAALSAIGRLPEVADPDAGEEARRRLIIHGVLTAAWGGPDVTFVNELEDRNTLVQDIDVEAIRRFHEWASRWEFPRPFEISKYEIRNVLWREFLEEEEDALRERGLWAEAVPGRMGGWEADSEGRYSPPADALDMPVRYVSARAVRAFADYLTRRLDEPGIEIRAPTPLEWEYAARGPSWNIFPWGDAFPGAPAAGTGDPKTRRGIDENSPLPVDYVDEDISPMGVVALGVNVAEWVEDFYEEDLDGDGVIDRLTERRYPRTEIRGASFAYSAADAATRARVWGVPISVDPRNAYAYTGVRLVKVRPIE